MKQIIIFLIFFASLIACKKDKDAAPLLPTPVDGAGLWVGYFTDYTSSSTIALNNRADGSTILYQTTEAFAIADTAAYIKFSGKWKMETGNQFTVSFAQNDQSVKLISDQASDKLIKGHAMQNGQASDIIFVISKK